MKVSLILGGDLYRAVRSSGFKLAVVIAGAAHGKVAVRVWRANSQRWTMVQRILISELAPLTERDLRQHRRTITTATDAALAAYYVQRVRVGTGLAHPTMHADGA